MVRRLALALLLGACAQPPAAIPYGTDAFMVPIAGTDARCPEYRMTSQTRAVVQAIFYRKIDGNFTMSRAEACG